MEVASFRALAAPVQTYTVARAQQEPPRFQGEQQPPDSGRVGTSAVRERQSVDENAEQLPRTASPLGLTGLIGFLSLAGVAALRTIRQRG